MPETAEIFVKKLKASGKLHEGFLLTPEQRENVLKSLAEKPESNVKIPKNPISGLPYSVVKSKEGTPFALMGFTKEIQQGRLNVIKIAQDLETGEFCLVKIARIKDLDSQKYKKDEAVGETEALKRTATFFKGHQVRTNPSATHAYKHYNFIKIVPGIRLSEIDISAKSPEVQCKIALNILVELQKFHKCGLIHRDLHRDNILIIPETLDITIIDLGLTVLADKEGYWWGHTIADFRGNDPKIRYANGVDTFELWNRIPFSDKKILKIIMDLKNKGVSKVGENNYPCEYEVVNLQPAIDALTKYYVSLQEDQNKPSVCSVSQGLILLVSFA